MTRRSRLLAALIAATAAGAALALALALDRQGGPAGASSQSGASFAGAPLPAGVAAYDFTLKDQSGQPVSLASFRGHVTLLAFLSTSCGGACELIAQQVRGALDDLPRAIPVVLVSVDPAADTPARVRSFLARVSLAGRARYLTGARRTLEPIWRAYMIPPLSAGRRSFERAASVVLLDRAGRERVIFGPEQLTPEGLAHDVRMLS